MRRRELFSALPIEKEVYFTNIKSKNNKLTAEIVHKLKHKISILGLEKSYQTAIDFEEDLKQQKSFNCPKLPNFVKYEMSINLLFLWVIKLYMLPSEYFKFATDLLFLLYIFVFIKSKRALCQQMQRREKNEFRKPTNAVRSDRFKNCSAEYRTNG